MLGRKILLMTILMIAGILPSTAFCTTAQTSLRLLYPSFAGSWATAWIAKEAGYFSAEGIDLELIRVGGSAHMVAAMLGGSAPITYKPEPSRRSPPTPPARGRDYRFHGHRLTLSSQRAPRDQAAVRLERQKSRNHHFRLDVRSSRAHRLEAVRPGTEQRCHALDVWRATRSLRGIATWRNTGGAAKFSTLPGGDEKRHA